MSSRSSSSSRNTVVHLLPKSRHFLTTRRINREGATMTRSPDGSRQVSTPTLRERRGRRDIHDSDFRPLSVFTKSLLVPFDHNFDKAFDALESDSPDRLATARSILSSDTNELATHEEDTEQLGDQLLQSSCLDSTTFLTDEEAEDQKDNTTKKKLFTPQKQEIRVAMDERLSRRESHMDLMTALQTTSPEKDCDQWVNGDFRTLCELPAPDPSQHPAFASEPFGVRTEAPLLSTSTSAIEIRTKSANGKIGSLGRQSIERKKSLFGLGIASPSSVKSRNAFSSLDGLQLAATSFTVAKTRSVTSSVKNLSPIAQDFYSPRESISIERSGGIRKLSDMFRRKESVEKGAFSPAWSPRESIDTPNTDRQDLESYLRRTTFTPSFDFDPYSSYPRHPNTGRGWKSRNLKCTTCLSVDCAVCHRVCCAYRAAVLALDNHMEESSARQLALQRIQDITKLFPYGKEAPTFLQCTAGVAENDMGCGKIVCPDCCSICPDDACADTLCRRCKPAMWEDCEWHTNGF